jgi:hypothetical protein
VGDTDLEYFPIRIKWLFWRREESFGLPEQALLAWSVTPGRQTLLFQIEIENLGWWH